MTEEAANAGPPPSADPQDPLPESAFLYRRIFSYGISICLIGLLALTVWRIDGADELRRVALYLCVLLFVVVTYYMLAPSAEQVVKMMQTAKLFLNGVRVRQTASAETPQGRATSSTTVAQRPMSSHPAPMSPQGAGSDFEEDAAPRGRT